LMDCRDVKLPLINKRYKVEFLDRIRAMRDGLRVRISFFNVVSLKKPEIPQFCRQILDNGLERTL